jgi:hypothetical protein
MLDLIEKKDYLPCCLIKFSLNIVKKELLFPNLILPLRRNMSALLCMAELFPTKLLKTIIIFIINTITN